MSAEVTDRSYAPGEVVLHEDAPLLSAPCCRVPDEKATALQRAVNRIFGGDESEGSRAPAGDAHGWSLLYLACEYLAASPDTRAAVQALPAPARVPAAKRSGVLAVVQSLRGQCDAAREGATGRELFGALLRAEAHAHHNDACCSVAVYRRGARVAHSCVPNTAFETGKDGSITYRALTEIDNGEEITSSYMGDGELLLPTSRRRAVLLRTKGFLCCCLRCSLPDRSRSVRCPKCKTGQVMPTAQLNLPAGDIVRMLGTAERDEGSAPCSEEQIATAKEVVEEPWRCQNRDCKASFRADEEPFCKEAEYMALVKQMEKKIADTDVAMNDIVPSVEDLLDKCEDTFGKLHWSVGCLLYDLTVHLQTVAMGFGSFELLKSASKTVETYAEWVSRAAPDVLQLVANAQFSAAHVCELAGLVDPAMLWYTRCLNFYATVYPGSPTANRIQAFLSSVGDEDGAPKEEAKKEDAPKEEPKKEDVPTSAAPAPAAATL